MRTVYILFIISIFSYCLILCYKQLLEDQTLGINKQKIEGNVINSCCHSYNNKSYNYRVFL